jgi:hypothetical protein
MSYKAALDADARIAAKNALKIMAALRQTFDAKAVYEQYLSTQPNKSDKPAQDRARARAWAIMNVTPNMQALNTVMQRVLAEGYVTGQAFADEQMRIAEELKKVDDLYTDWANWQPGDRAAALLLRPPDAFQRLLQSQGIALKEMSQTTVRDVGNAVADAIELGMSADRSAKNIMRQVANPARALSIAITEQNRAISFATVERYKQGGLQQMEWEVSDPCKICAQNTNQVVNIGSAFASGDTQPPAHPHCRCVLLPVIPDFGATDDVGGTITTPTTDADGAIQIGSPAPVTLNPAEWTPVSEERWIEKQTAYRIARKLPPPNDVHLKIIRDQFKDASIILERGTSTVLLDKSLTTVTDEMLDAFLQNYDAVYDKLPAWRKFNYDGTPKDFLILIKEGVEGRRGNVLGYTYLGHDTIWFSAKTVRGSIKPPRILTDKEASLLTQYLPGGKVKTRWSMPAAYEVNDNLYTIAHEFGHVVDSTNNDRIRGKFVGGLRRKYKDGNFWSAYGTENPKEAYAETFAQWLLGEQTPVTEAFAERFGWNLGLEEYWDLTPAELQWIQALRLTGQG